MTTALIVMIIGLVLFIVVNLDSKGRLPVWMAEIGRIAFFAGLLAVLLK